jgi:hypothetical protein
MLKSFEIEDDLANQDQGGIEVVLWLEDGRRRWCYFMTPRALTNCGDYIEGTRTRIHYNAPYMVVIAGRLDEKVIETALRQIDRDGELEACSMPLDSEPHETARHVGSGG